MKAGNGWRRAVCRAANLLFLLSLGSHALGGGEEPGALKGTVQVQRARHSGGAIVYLDGKGLEDPSPPEEHAVMDQKNLIFTPHLLPIQRGTTVDFPNSDNVRHNVFSPPGAAKQFNLGTYGVGVTKSMRFDEVGEIPLLCNVHTEMSAYIVVLPNPFFATTDRDGNFSIRGIPPGRYTLKTWHEKRRPLSREVEIPAGGTAEVHLELARRR